MKKIAFTFVLIFLLPLCFFASENNLSENTELKKSKAGIVAIPDPKRPKTPDAEKCEEASSFDENSQTLQKYRDTLKYGVSSDIVDLLQKFISNDDPRLVNEVYDLFQKTKAIPTREKVLEYFAHFKDPCLEDYAIEILNDPYDIKNTTVSLVFQYVADVKCKSAVPAIITLLEANDHAYFNPCLATLGDIGGAEEALYLAEFIDRDDLTVAQKQSLARVLGKLHATETWEKLVSLAQDENENPFVRMYSAEAIGEMKKAESVPILVDLYESDDPNFRLYVIKGLANFPESEDAKRILIEGIRDEHYKVRLEAIAACKKMNFTEAVPMLVYRAKNEKETVVKKACYPAIALLNTKDGNEYLISMLKEKKLSDNTKAEAAVALIGAGNAGETELVALALDALKDEKRKNLRYAIGKEFAKHNRTSYADVCREYLLSKDVATVSIGLDMYKKGRYESCANVVKDIALDKKTNNNKKKARRLLGMSEDDTDESSKK